MVLAGGTITDEVRRKTNIGGETTLERQERFCVSQGGKWDAENNRCIRKSELDAQALKERQAAAKEIVQPTTPEIVPKPEPIFGIESDKISTLGRTEGTTPGGQVEKAKEALGFLGGLFTGDTSVSDVGQRIDPQEAGVVRGLALGGGVATLQAVAPAVAAFFARAAPKATGAVSKAAAPGSRALGTNPRALGTNPRNVQAVLTSPTKLKVANGLLKKAVIGGIATGASFFGLGKAVSITTEVLVGKSKKIESEASKLGDLLTKIPEASSHGFHLEDGNVVEYTQSMALSAIADTEQELLDAKEMLQQNSIGNAYLKFNNDHRGAVSTVDKQLAEIDAAESKVLEQIAVPSETLQAVREFWRGVDLE